METIPVNVSGADYEWLKMHADQRKMTVAQIIEELVRSTSALDVKRRDSVLNLQDFVKQPPAFTPEDTEVLEQIMMMAREGKIIPPEILRGDHESPSGDYNDERHFRP